MNYVAEPYVALVDQLLTGLTGGEAREVHRFFPAENGYSLTRPYAEVKADSVKVVGQYKQVFNLFVPGRDWRLSGDGKIHFRASADEAGLPAEDANWPDEGSEFYVYYYHQESHKALLTDRNVGSLNRTLVEAFSRELAVLEKQLELVYRSGFIDSAERGALEQVVALLGVKRKGGEYATGTVRFYRDSAAPGDIFIPAGVRVSTALNPPVSFITTSGKTLRQGQLSVEAGVRAEQKGADGVVAAAAISVLNEAIHGVNGLVNDAPTLFAGGKESDTELRARAKRVMERAGRATPGAMISAITSYSGLKENEVKLVEELADRPGVVKLFIARPSTSELAAKVDVAVTSSRPAGVRVEHNLKSALLGTEDGVLPPDVPGRDDEEPEDGAASTLDDGFTLPVKCLVKVYAENPRLAAEERSTMQRAIVEAVFAYVDQGAIGESLIYNRIVANVMAVSGITDVVLDLYPASAATATGKKNLRVTDGQRAIIENKESDIQVIFTGAPVYFDFRITPSLKGTHTLNEADLEIKERLVSFFATAPTTIDAAALLALLQPSNLHDLSDANLHWSIEYDQAGLTIRERDEVVDLSEEERAVLRKVTVEAAD